MKRFLLLTLALLLFAAPALAEGRVHDEAGVFTDSQAAALEKQIEEIRDAYQFDVVLVTETDIGSYTTWDYAADFYDYGGYGYGDGHDGILLLLVVGGGVGNRDFYMLTTGRGETVFNQYRLEDIENRILPALRRSDFSSAADRFVQEVSRLLEKNRPRSAGERVQSALPFLAAAGLAVSLIVTSVMRAGMRTVRRKQDASSYVQKSSFRLTRNQDIFLYTTTTRQRIETSSSRSGGFGGSGHSGGGFTGSSGTHHGGHGGKF